MSDWMIGVLFIAAIIVAAQLTLISINLERIRKALEKIANKPAD